MEIVNHMLDSLEKNVNEDKILLSKQQVRKILKGKTIV